MIKVYHKTTFPFFYYDYKPDIMTDVVEGYFLTNEQLAELKREYLISFVKWAIDIPLAESRKIEKQFKGNISEVEKYLVETFEKAQATKKDGEG